MRISGKLQRALSCLAALDVDMDNLPSFEKISHNTKRVGNPA